MKEFTRRELKILCLYQAINDFLSPYTKTIKPISKDIKTIIYLYIEIITKEEKRLKNLSKKFEGIRKQIRGY